LCKDVTREQAADLLLAARKQARPVNPKRLGAVGAEAFPDTAYVRTTGTIEVGSIAPFAVIPFVVEAWAFAGAVKTRIDVCVNRTPITGDVRAARDKREIHAFGCGLRHTIATAPIAAQFDIRINLITPYMPITSDGKTPNLAPFLEAIMTAAGK